MIRTDRIFGLVMIFVALAYIASAYNLPAGNMFDKLGPKAFPYMVGLGLILSAAGLVLYPDAEPDWPRGGTLLSLAFATIILIAYTYTLKPLGFLLPTAVAAGILSYQITPNARLAPVIGLALSLGLFLLFRYGLQLSLFAFPRGWF